MKQNDAKAILAALTPEARAERQRIVDAAVRYAARSDYCDTFNSLIAEILPEMAVEDANGYFHAFNSDGEDCRGRHVSRILDGFGGPIITPDGYDAQGYDRDGRDRRGMDRNGRDEDGFTVSYDRDGYMRNGFSYNETRRAWPEDYPDFDWSEAGLTRVRYVYLDRDGNIRLGRPESPEDAVAEPPFNPTTWQPATVTVG
jgi:hypothetical protein